MFAPRIRILLLTLAAAGSVLLGDAAHAASCRAMKAELASLASKSTGAARYRSAIRRQRKQMARVETLMRSHACASRRSKTCTVLRGSFRDMERNMRELNRRAGKSGSSRKRARLRKRIAARCNAKMKRKPRTARASKRQTINAAVRSRGPSRISGKGRFRTMCVRTCDGLVFPASRSTGPRRFATDAKACAALCPGTEIRLYAAPASASGVRNARDVETGEPYPDLPTAFRHREVFDKACACRFAGSEKLDYGRKVAKKMPPAEPALREARDVRIVGTDYFKR